METYKNILIIFLLILLFSVYYISVAKVDDNIDKEMDTIEKLTKINDSLVSEKDSITTLNKELTNKLIDTKIKLDSINKRLVSVDKDLKKIRHEKTKINNYVNSLGTNEFSRVFTDYLTTRKDSI